MTYLNPDTKIATHAALSQSVHGVGANDIADVADISTHAAVTTNVHGTGAGNVVVGDDEISGFESIRSNVLLNAFDISMLKVWSIHNMLDGVRDVFVRVWLRYNGDDTLSANAYVDRSNDENESDWTNLFSHNFSVPIALDTYYTLSIRFEGKKLIFDCNGETAEHNITTPTYPAYGEHRSLQSRVYLDSGDTGYIKVRFDDVYIEKKVKFNPSIPMLLLSGE